MATVLNFRNHVSVVCDLEVGQKVMVDNWGPALNNKVCIIEEIKLTPSTESSVSVKIDRYPNFIDVGWIKTI